MQTIEIGLARPSASPDRIKPLLLMKFPDIDAGFGIDMVRANLAESGATLQRQLVAEGTSYRDRSTPTGPVEPQVRLRRNGLRRRAWMT